MGCKTGRTTIFSEEDLETENFYWRDWTARENRDVENIGYDCKTLTKKAKAWKEILKKFNSQNTDGIKRDMSQL